MTNANSESGIPLNTRYELPNTSRRGLKKSLNLTHSALALAFLTLPLSVRADDEDHYYRHAPELPSPVCDSADVPAGNRVSSHAYASGAQIYRWSGTHWTFVAPEATLFADPCYDQPIGIHYAGPTWEANDGSKVVGSLQFPCTPFPGAIPWLRLGAASSPGRGRFTRLTYIQRINTIGGTAPAGAGVRVGDEVRVPYTAEYYFYRAAKR